MTKQVTIALTLVLLVFAVLSCATSDSSYEKPPSDMPRWYLNPKQADDMLYGVGSAKMSKVDTSRKMAIARAREDVAFQVSGTIKAAITDYAQEAGADDNNQVLSFVETVSKQITDTKLVGAKVDELYVGKDGTVYARVVYPVNQYLEDAKGEFIRNEDAAFAEFKANQALDRLDEELRTNPPKSNPQ